MLRDLSRPARPWSLIRSCVAMGLVGSVGCADPQTDPAEQLPDGPFVRAVMRHEDGSSTTVTASATYSHDADIGTCSGEDNGYAIELQWPHDRLVLGDFDVGDQYIIYTSIPQDEGTLEAEWAGWIQFDEIGEQVEGRFELGPREDQIGGITAVERGAFRCEAG
jgi:hypothetical protein